jgi:glyoxylase-like metal-dependent hydrolase (beta-lactamase superfamily II)
MSMPKPTRAILLPAGNASAWTGPTGNNTYLLPGRTPTLIDAGVGKQEHLDAIARALEGRDLALVLVTHGHSDHVSGLPAISARWPGVLIRQFGTASKPLQADETIEAGDDLLIVRYTPGHAPDHCCFQAGDEMFCGDLVRLGGTIVIPGSRGGNLIEYLASLRRIRSLQPRVLLPGHGPAIADPAALIDGYLRHRAEREQQVVEALESGCVTPEQIVRRIYADLSSELTLAARESVLAHLIKLQQEGRARERDGTWTL